MAAPESANNAVTGGALIPMMTLGIPGDPVTAILIGALLVHGLAPGPLALEAAELAERLGYHRVWLYDSAAIWEDIWVHMGRIATATERIGLGTAVLVPNLRHVMTTASAIATICAPPRSSSSATCTLSGPEPP